MYKRQVVAHDASVMGTAAEGRFSVSTGEIVRHETVRAVRSGGRTGMAVQEVGVR